MGRHIGEILRSGSDLLPQAERLLALQEAAQRLLPPNLRAACAVANLREHTLVMFASNNAVAAKARMHAASLIQGLNERGYGIKELKVEVQPQFPRPRTAKGAKVPKSAGEPLQKLADKLPDSPLRRIVQSLKDRSD